jgi:subtilase family serine protease
MNRARWGAALLGAAVIGAGLTGQSAVAATARSSGGPSTATIRLDLRAGTLGRTHAYYDACRAGAHGIRLNLGCQSLVVAKTATGSGAATPMTTADPAGYSPAELATAYHLPAASTSTRTIAIVGVGAYPSLAADLATYRSQYGLPACTTANGCLKITDYKGGPALASNPSMGSVEEAYAEETALDVDMASAACPSCKIDMVQIPENYLKLLLASYGSPDGLAADFGTAVNEAAALGASAVSMSYGLPGASGHAAVETGATAKALHHPGMAVVASSGDAGYTGTAQLWPARLPWVTAAGGTSLKTADGGQTYTNTAWGSLFTPKGQTTSKWVGAGSGCATDLPPAQGQPAAVAAICGGHRAVADASADADPLTGVAVYDTYTPNSGSGGGWTVVGGTSAASPYLAGLYARAGNLTSVDGPNTLYTAPSGTLTDVTGGSNSQSGATGCKTYDAALCTGAPGWDGVTGLGTPNGLGAF